MKCYRVCNESFSMHNLESAKIWDLMWSLVVTHLLEQGSSDRTYLRICPDYVKCLAYSSQDANVTTRINNKCYVFQMINVKLYNWLNTNQIKVSHIFLNSYRNMYYGFRLNNTMSSVRATWHPIHHQKDLSKIRPPIGFGTWSPLVPLLVLLFLSIPLNKKKGSKRKGHAFNYYFFLIPNPRKSQALALSLCHSVEGSLIFPLVLWSNDEAD